MGVLDFVGLGGDGDWEVLSEAGGIVVSDGFTVSEGFEDGVTDLDCFLDSKLLSNCLWIMNLLMDLLVVEVNEPETLFVGLGFACAWLARYDHGLGLAGH